ncbi:MAG: hypothetical protein OXH60_12620 [Rhodospirillales bacterium]|nr:hypothetical protein [Rhodospirillales bacterium]
MPEYRIDFDPGYRTYFDMDGPAPIILLGEGIRSRLQQDVEATRILWCDYKCRTRDPRTGCFGQSGTTCVPAISLASQ